MDTKFKEVDRTIEEVTRKVRAFVGEREWFVEELIIPRAVTLFRERGITVNRISQRVKAQKHGEGIAIDILVMDQEHVVLIEARSTLSVDDVKEHVDRMKAFKRFFPEYRDRKAIGAVAVVLKDVPDYALVVGNPGRVVGWMCVCGNRIDFEREEGRGRCRDCGRVYRKVGQRVALQ